MKKPRLRSKATWPRSAGRTALWPGRSWPPWLEILQWVENVGSILRDGSTLPTLPHLKHHLRSGVPSELLPTVTISPERKAFLRNTGKERSMSRMVVAHCREGGARKPLVRLCQPAAPTALMAEMMGLDGVGRELGFLAPSAPGNRVINSNTHRGLAGEQISDARKPQPSGVCTAAVTYYWEGWGLGQTREHSPT